VSITTPIPSINRPTMPTSEAVILTNPEDWEEWLNQLRASADEEIWDLIDPNESEAEENPLGKPKKPKVRDFDANVNSYAQLSESLQKAYENSRKFYESDLKEYRRQQDLLRAVRTYISTHVSKPKALLLDPTKSTYDWLVKLKEDTEPTKNFMKKKAKQQYADSLKGLKQAKISQWLDRWEHAMKMAIKYKIPEIDDGSWLHDLADAIQPISDTFSVLYRTQADDNEKNESSEYRKVALRLRENFAHIVKRTTTSGTMRGSAFNADFAGESEEGDSNTTESQNRKRAGTTSVEEGKPTKKLKGQKCPACELKGHTLEDCWYLFEDKRPEGFKASSVRMEKMKKRMEKDKGLAIQIEKLKVKEERVTEID